MTFIKASTKKGQGMLQGANRRAGVSLNDIYGKASAAKWNAYAWCRERCRTEGGYDFHITSYNTFGFSVAWRTAEGARIETPANSYLIVG